MARLAWPVLTHGPMSRWQLLTVLVLLPNEVGGQGPPVPSRSTQLQTVQRLVAAAVQRAGLASRAVSWRRRLAWAALLPRVSVKVSRSDGWGEYLDFRSDQPAMMDTNNHQRTALELRASWDLSRLIFDSRELSLARTADGRAVRRQKLIEEIIRLYYQREVLLHPNRTSSQTPEAAQARAVALGRLTATLQALTGVALGQHTEKRR